MSGAPLDVISSQSGMLPTANDSGSGFQTIQSQDKRVTYPHQIDSQHYADQRGNQMTRYHDPIYTPQHTPGAPRNFYNTAQQQSNQQPLQQQFRQPPQQQFQQQQQPQQQQFQQQPQQQQFQQQQFQQQQFQQQPHQQNHKTFTNRDVQNRISQSEQMSNKSFEQQMQHFNHMNNAIMGHRMSNMDSLEAPPSLPRGDHVQFDNEMIASDNVQAPRLKSNPMPMKRGPQFHPKQQPSNPHSENTRKCRCKPGQPYCGSCQNCGMPGHNRAHPNPSKRSGSWCDPHYEREKREVMKTNPDLFLSYNTYKFDPATQDSFGQIGPPRTINPAAPQFRNAPKVPLPSNKNVSINHHSATTTPSVIGQDFPGNMMNHHEDRQISPQGHQYPTQMGGGNSSLPQPQRSLTNAQMKNSYNPRGPSQQSPYTLNSSNIENFKGNNPFTLSRTTINSELVTPKENIDYVGFNAQGEKIRDPNYYKNAPGKQNEFDHYSEYKKNSQSGDYQPSNSFVMNDQYRPYQGNIPPKKAKLSRQNIQRFQSPQ
tara:strand:- start:150 stop:1763 length:1614 start_codon:yes stop_codon:yes gene_type:complete